MINNGLFDEINELREKRYGNSNLYDSYEGNPTDTTKRKNKKGKSILSRFKKEDATKTKDTTENERVQ